MKYLLSLLVMGIGGFTLVACGDFATRNTCLGNAPNCNPDQGFFEVPNLNGPNPNFPDPNAAPPMSSLDDEIRVIVSSVVINEVLLASGGPDAQAIEIRNLTDGTIDLSAWRLEYNSEMFEFPEGFSIGAQSVASLVLSEPVEAAVGEEINALYTTKISSMDTLNGSLALVDSLGQIADFIQWGSSGHHLEMEAWREGRWTPGQYVAAPLEGQSIHRVQMPAGDAAYVSDFPTIGNIGSTVPADSIPENKGILSDFAPENDGTSE